MSTKIPTPGPALAVLSLLLSLIPGPSAIAQDATLTTSTPRVFNGSLNDLPAAPKAALSVREIPRRGGGLRPPLAADPGAIPGPAVSPKGGGFGIPGLNQAGQGYASVNPPDPVGDVGQQHYIQATNGAADSLFSVYRKSDGQLLAGPTEFRALGGSGACLNEGFDPIVVYDALASRWLLLEAIDDPPTLCVYLSQSADPLAGGWYHYTFSTPEFPDYPKLGVWSDAYYVTTNEGSPAVYALERTAMLQGQAARMLRDTAPPLAGFGFQALLPADHDGSLAPPSGSPGVLMRHRDDELHGPAPADPTQDYLELWTFSTDFANPPADSLIHLADIPIANFSSDLACADAFNCLAQPGVGNPQLDALPETILWRLPYRRFADHETLLGTFATQVLGDRVGLVWFELRRTDGDWQLYQSGIHSPDTTNRWLGSIAMDGDGNIALGYNVVSTTVFPGIRYSGRLAGDPPGTLAQGEFVIQNGQAANASNRYGDYSAMTLDPVDDCTFWFTGEYNPSSEWATRIATLRFPGCESAVRIFDDGFEE